MPDRPSVTYARESDLQVADFRSVLVEAGLGAIRPIDDAPRLQAMLEGANLTITARLARPDQALVGVARCLTDYSWCCYLAELAVSRSVQGLGIGRGLLCEVRRQVGPNVGIILLSVPESASFYERIGMARLPDAFWFPRER